MIIESERMEEHVRSVGVGAYSQFEYTGYGSLVLRVADVRVADASGTVRVYFDIQREQVITGRRFDPMGSGLILLRPNTFYCVQSHIEVIKPIPGGVTCSVVLRPEIAEVMMITGGVYMEGYTGVIRFTVQPFRKVEIERMVSLANLVVTGILPDVPDVTESVKVRKPKSKVEV